MNHRIQSLQPSRVLALLLIAMCACDRDAKPQTEVHDEEKPGTRIVAFDPAALARLGVKVSEVGSDGKEQSFEVNGNLEYNHEKYAEVGTLAEGRITTIRVHVGDLVKKGSVLGTLMVPSIAGVQAEYVAAEAAAKIAKENEEREKGLLAKDLTTAREAEVARAESVRTQAELAAASAKLQAMGVGRPASGGAIAAAGSITLVAPIDGIVVKRDAVLGRYLQAKETAFVVADPTDLRAAIQVFEHDLSYFKLGSSVEIVVDAMPGKVFKGTVSHIEADVDRRTRAVRALIAVPNPDRALKPGEFVRASIKLPESVAGTRVLIPAGAVQPLADDDVVFVQKEPGKFEVRKIVIARRTAQVVEVAQGVSKGEALAVEGAFVLRGEVAKQ